jgi:hypothetical protein
MLVRDVVIEAPGLRNMIVRKIDGVMFDFHVPSLVEASVSLLDWGGIVEDGFEVLFCSLQNATNLYLYGLPSIDQVLPLIHNTCPSFSLNLFNYPLRVLWLFQVPMFHNLRTLLLKNCNLTGQVCTTLDLFMCVAPNLVELTVENCQVHFHLCLLTCDLLVSSSPQFS